MTTIEDAILSSKEKSGAIAILRQIEENTRATHFWVRVMGIPVLIGMVCGVIAMLLAI